MKVNISNFITSLAKNKKFHKPGTKAYSNLKNKIIQEIYEKFGEKAPQQFNFKKIGKLVFPFHKMGSITSVELFLLFFFIS